MNLLDLNNSFSNSDYKAGSSVYKIFIIAVLAVMIFFSSGYATIESKYDKDVFDSYAKDGYITHELSKGIVVEQRIDINGEINTIGFYPIFDSENENYGNVDVIIFSGDSLEYRQTINTAKLSKDELFYLDTPTIDGSNAKIVFEGVDGDIGSSMSLYCSPKVIFGSVLNDGFGKSNKEYSIALSISAKKIASLHNIRVLSLLAMLVLFLFASKTILSSRQDKKELKLYIASILIIILNIIIVKPMDIISVEPYAETSYLFYKVSVEYPKIQSLFVADAGYLPFIQHLTSTFLTTLFNAPNSILLMKIFAVTFIAMACSRFVLNCYNKYFNVEIRFLICVFLGLLFTNGQNTLTTFLNFAYAGGVIIILNALLDFNELRRWEFLYACVITALIILSKAIYVVTLPVAFILFFVSIRGKNKRVAVFTGLITVASIAQLFITFSNMDIWAPSKIVFSKMIINSIYGGIGDLIRYLPMTSVQRIGTINIISLAIILFIFSVSIRRIIAEKNVKDNVLILSMLITAVSGYVLIFYSRKIYDITLLEVVDWSTTEAFELNRFIIFQLILLFFSCLLLINLHVKTNYKSFAVIALVAAILINLILIPITPQTPSKSMSNWKEYSKHYAFEQEHIIFSEPPNYALKYNTKLVYIGEFNRKAQDGSRIYTEEMYELDIDGKELSSVNLKDYLGRDQKVIAVMIKKHGLLQKDGVIAVFYDKNGDEIARQNMVDASDRIYVGFMMNEAIKNVCSISFINQNEEKYSIQPEVYIGVVR